MQYLNVQNIIFLQWPILWQSLCYIGCNKQPVHLGSWILIFFNSMNENNFNLKRGMGVVAFYKKFYFESHICLFFQVSHH